MQVEVGDRVKYTSTEWGDSPANPLWGGRHGYVVGTVDNLMCELDVHVNWDNGGENYYRFRDLERCLGHRVEVKEHRVTSTYTEDRLTTGDEVIVKSKTAGRKLSREQLKERFGDSMLGRVLRFEGKDVIVLSLFNEREYRFAMLDLSISKQSKTSMTDKFGLVKLTIGQKLRLSADDKAKVRAGLIDTCSMSLTDKGRGVLESILVEKFEEELTKAATDIIAEAEASAE